MLSGVRAMTGKQTTYACTSPVSDENLRSTPPTPPSSSLSQESAIDLLPKGVDQSEYSIKESNSYAASHHGSTRHSRTYCFFLRMYEHSDRHLQGQGYRTLSKSPAIIDRQGRDSRAQLLGNVAVKDAIRLCQTCVVKGSVSSISADIVRWVSSSVSRLPAAHLKLLTGHTVLCSLLRSQHLGDGASEGRQGELSFSWPLQFSHY